MEISELYRFLYERERERERERNIAARFKIGETTILSLFLYRSTLFAYLHVIPDDNCYNVYSSIIRRVSAITFNQRDITV